MLVNVLKLGLVTQEKGAKVVMPKFMSPSAQLGLFPMLKWCPYCRLK